MDKGYRVIYQGRLRRGQTRSGVAGRLSETLGRDRAFFETLLEGPEQVLLKTSSEADAQRLAEIFRQAGADVRLERPEDVPSTASPAASDPNPGHLKPSVPPSFGQRVWLLRAAAVLLIVSALAGLGFTLLVVSFFVLSFSYTWVLGLLPWPAVVVPVYVALLAVLVLIIAGLAKPFVRFQPRLPVAVTLERVNEPVLFDFIAYVCEAIRVPCPKTVSVDMCPSVRAGAAPGSELTIGLPVLASVTTAELGGLVARAVTLHIGGVSGRLGRFVAGLVHVLYEAVHGRDLFDHALQRGLQSRNVLLVHLARELSTLLRLSRRILAYLLKEAIGTSAAAMQSIEWHRDRHQAWITGAGGFNRSLRLMRLLRFAAERSEAALRDAWQNGGALPADLPRALQLRLKALARQSTLGKIMAAAEAEQEPVTQFHVADGVRIERVVKSGMEPTLCCATPASALLQGFALLSRRVSVLYYRNQLQLPVTPGRLQSARDANQPLLDAISGGAFTDTMFVAPGRFLDRARTTTELVAATREFNARVRTSGQQAGQSVARNGDLGNSLIASLFEEVMLRAGRSTRATRDRLETVQIRCRSLEDELDKHYKVLDGHGELVSRRIANAIVLLERPETAARRPGARALAARAIGLCEALDRLQQQMGVLRELETHLAVLELLLTRCPDRPGAALKDRIAEQQAEIGSRLTALRVATKRMRNPLEDNTHVFEHVRAGWVPTSARYAELDEASVVFTGLLRLRRGIIARLVMLARAAEDAWVRAEDVA
jgi:hypothetical protein